MSASKMSKTVDSPSASSGSWMITFGDLLMLLLTFFVLLLTMKSLDQKDVRELFPNISLHGGPLEYSETGFTGNAPDFYGDNEKAVLVENKEAMEQLLSVMKNIQTSLPEEDVAARFKQLIHIEENPKGVVVSFQTEQLFEPGKTDINPSQVFLLDAAGELLQMTTNQILIFGHTSTLKPEKSGLKTNWELSLYRALQVLYYLTANFEMMETRLGVGGFGDKNQKFLSGDAAIINKNDRIEFILMKTKI